MHRQINCFQCTFHFIGLRLKLFVEITANSQFCSSFQDKTLLYIFQTENPSSINKQI